MGYLTEKCTPRLLADVSADALAGFSCRLAPDVEDFFRNEALAYSRQMLGQSYCFTDNDTGDIVAAFCLANASVSTDDIPKPIRNKINRMIPYAKQRETYPAVLLAQLAVSDRYAHHHLGDELMSLIAVRLVMKWQATSGRFLITDAINTPKVIAYYQRNNFILVFKSEDEEREYCDVNPDDRLKTRYMLTDLGVIKTRLGLLLK